MPLPTTRIARERLLLRRARQRAALIARLKEVGETTPRPTLAPRLSIPPVFCNYNAAAVGRLLVLGHRRGYVSFDELNDVLPESEISTEEIEGIISAIYDLGIKLTEVE